MTLDYYKQRALAYSQETQSVDFRSCRNLLLKHLGPKGHILDLGCGSGRDSKAFLDLGYQVTAMDGSKALCQLASRYIKQAVICRSFQDLDETNTYDGVWACASLLHVPLQELPGVFRKIRKALKPGGYVYASFKLGEFEGERDGRYFTDLTKKKLEGLLGKLAGLGLIELVITEDVMPGRARQQWLNFILQKERAER